MEDSSIVSGRNEWFLTASLGLLDLRDSARDDAKPLTMEKGPDHGPL